MKNTLKYLISVSSIFTFVFLFIASEDDKKTGNESKKEESIKEEKLPTKFCGNFHERDLSDNPTSSVVEIKDDGTWIWKDGSEELAFGDYKATHQGEWAFGPDSWVIDFSTKGGSKSSYFDKSQVIFFHDINNATGERNYYRLNGSMPGTDAATNFFKK